MKSKLYLLALIIGTASNALAFYNPSTGRWLSRDPAGEVMSKNLYGFVVNNTLNKYDVLGQWHRNLHYDATMFWAVEAGFGPSYAAMIGEADAAVDGPFFFGSTGPWPSPFGETGRHLMTLGRGGDSRMWHYNNEYIDALAHLEAAQRTQTTLECAEAARSYARGLHSLQDISPHRAYPGGISWPDTALHPYWWDAWTDDQYGPAPWYCTADELWWRNQINQPPLYYPYATDNADIRAQQEQLQRTARNETTTASRNSLSTFVRDVRRYCICRNSMLLNP